MTSVAALLYAWHDGNLRDPAPILVSLVLCSVIGMWLRAKDLAGAK